VICLEATLSVGNRTSAMRVPSSFSFITIEDIHTDIIVTFFYGYIESDGLGEA